ncbi:MAG TPA: alpha/beta fold hydrolase [Bryobacteraceae bacterium]|nr:alpha/beta fold hydrolase [Bryobacteraceae bacterium]
MESQRPRGAARGELVMVHGLEGSGEAGYMRGLSQAALDAGFAAHRFHMRTCGGTEHLCQTLYHSGLTSDLLAVLREMAADGLGPVFLAGFSLGGNVVLKLAGELREDAPALFRGVCAVSTPIDLAASCDRLAKWDNRLYEWRFIRSMQRRLSATGRYRAEDFAGVRSIRDLDNRITAPAFGFRDALHYYQSQSAALYLDNIRVPAMLIQAQDDPIIPFESYHHPAFGTNPNLTLLAPDHGGHVGFVARGNPRFWAEAAIIEWISFEIEGTNTASTSSSH